MDFVWQHADALTAVLTLLLALGFCRQWLLRYKPPMRRLALFALVLGPSWVALRMGTHLLANLYQAVERVLAHSFEYNFEFYSLMLMGVVFMGLSLRMLQQAQLLSQGRSRASRQFCHAAIALVALSAPTFPLTPVGLLPTLACAVAGLGLTFLYKPVRQLA
ncbi:hypothetical protein LRS06_15585 [Hymenobacter sp. J193]|uniref:hypothetical protein n=1 Tax=Hymenobacter sp. J193 TaxID=2898429 RepID=UPI002151F1FF|nr:hypothetical protein [Hymenobacter sp. J193]MCR5889159.1 hypothetical protein [Hymenobacter sp. J193]